MIEVLFFLLGAIIGGSVSFVFLCCIQINRINEYEAEIRKLKREATK